MLWILLVLVLVAVLSTISIYNQIILLKQNVQNGFAQIDVQLKRRHDLIPNLVEVAKGYMGHEKETLENVTKARQQAVDAKGLGERVQAENFLSSTLRSLFAVAENYPNLKADQHMIRVQEELTSTENKIAFARQYYNDEVARLNTVLQTFPNNVVAGLFGFKSGEYLQLDQPAERQAPQVKF